MDDKDDFILVKGKLPKNNKDGSPTVGHLGAGGLRRDDGTVERLVQDLKPLDEPDDASAPSTVGVPCPPETPPERFREHLARAAIEGIMSGVGDSIRRATGKEPAEALVDFIEDRLRRWLRERRSKKSSTAFGAGRTAEVSTALESVDAAAQVEAMSFVPEAAGEDTRPPLSREEAEIMYRQMLRSAVISEALRRRLSGARVLDQDGAQALEDITRAELDQFVSQALERNPDLITDILLSGRRSEGQLIPETIETAKPPLVPGPE